MVWFDALTTSHFYDYITEYFLSATYWFYVIDGFYNYFFGMFNSLSDPSDEFGLLVAVLETVVSVIVLMVIVAQAVAGSKSLNKVSANTNHGTLFNRLLTNHFFSTQSFFKRTFF